MPPCNCHPPFPRPEPFSPLPRPGRVPDWGKWIRDRLAEKGALLVFPTRASFPSPGAWPNLYLDQETGAVYRWDREDYAVLFDPREGNDVLVYDSVAAFPDEGEQGKLYIAANTGGLYRWGGEDYVALLPGKADKVVPAAEGNLAELTQDGNLADSGKKPADFADAENTYTKAETDEAIDRVAAYYITRNAAGDAFETKAQLNSATVFYSGGKVRTPTRNDYCVVLADETHDNAEYRYIYAVADGETTGSWQPQFPVEGVMTIDQTVTKNSTNPVASGGVWSALWGALASLPTGFTSLYDWCVSQLAGKVPTSRTVNGKPLSSDVTLEADDVGALPSTTDGSNRYVSADVHFTGADGDIWLPLGGTGTLTYLPRNESTTQNNLVAWKDGGGLADSGKKPSDFQTALSDAQLANIAAVPNKANDSAVVHKSGDTMTGLLTVPRLTVGSRKDGSATGMFSSTQGRNNEASGGASHAEGESTTAQNNAEHSQGKYNASHTGTTSAEQTLSSIGFGDSDNNRKNAVETMQDGKTFIYNLGGYDGTNPTSATDLASVVNAKATRASEPTADHLATLDSQGNPTDSQIPKTNVALKGNIPYALVTKAIIDNAVVTLDDHASNSVTISAALVRDTLIVHFPTATSGKVRDFAMRLNIAAGVTAPEIAWPQGVTLENDGGEVPEIADGGTGGSSTILYFSETENNGTTAKFLVKGETLTAITQA